MKGSADQLVAAAAAIAGLAILVVSGALAGVAIGWLVGGAILTAGAVAVLLRAKPSQVVPVPSGSASGSGSASHSHLHYIADMSHELRTPLVGLVGMADTLTNSDSTNLPLAAAEVYAHAQDLMALIDDVLDSVKASAGELHTEPAPIEGRALAVELRHLVRRTAGRHVRFVLRDDELPEWIEIDASRVVQVVRNLVEGMARATRDELVVELGYEPIGHDTGLLLVQVGPEHPQVGSPGATWLREGIRSDICHRLVTAMGGTLQPSGTGRLLLRLPADVAEPTRPIQVDSLNIAARQLRVLVVDDEPTSLAVARATLARLGHDVRAAASGQGALDILEKEWPDVVFMDCQMPGLSGIETVEVLRRLEREQGRRRTPVVALTAHAMRFDRDRCLAAGMDDYVSKPCRGERLQDVLNALAVGHPRWQDASSTPRPATAEEATWALEPAVMASFRELGAGPVGEVVDAFRRSTPGVVASIRAALAEEDADAMRVAAHRLKGAAGSIGASRLQQVAADIEVVAMAGRTDAAARCVAALDEAVQHTGHTLTLILAELSADEKGAR